MRERIEKLRAELAVCGCGGRIDHSYYEGHSPVTFYPDETTEEIFSVIDALQATIDRVAALPEKWRADEIVAAEPEGFAAVAFGICADELEAALAGPTAERGE